MECILLSLKKFLNMGVFLQMNSKVLYLDKFGDKKKLHRYIASVLDFPKYYGNNLDALYEVLTDMTNDICINIVLSDNDNYYALRLIDVFMDAAKANSHITISLGDADE